MLFRSLTGGGGVDTFVIDASHLTAAVDDLITDFGAGDVLDLSDLFATLGAGAPNTAAQASSIFQLTGSAGNTLVQVDSNGTAVGGSMETVATLNGTHASVLVLFKDGETPASIT